MLHRPTYANERKANEYFQPTERLDEEYKKLNENEQDLERWVRQAQKNICSTTNKANRGTAFEDAHGTNSKSWGAIEACIGRNHPGGHVRHQGTKSNKKGEAVGDFLRRQE